MKKILTPKVRVVLSLFILIVSIVAWPVTALTVFRNEPQGILGLSWFAIILTCADIAATTDVRNEQEGK